MPAPTRLSCLADSLMEACWLAGLVVTPLFFNVYSVRIFEPDKTALLRSLALLIAAAWAVKLIETSNLKLQNPKPRPLDHLTTRPFGLLRLPLLAPALGVLAVALLGVALSVNPRVSLWGSYARLQGAYTTACYLIVFAAVYANLRRQAQLGRLVTTIILTSFPVAIYSILQHYALDPVQWGGSNTTERVTGTLGNAIFVAAYLILACLLTVGRVVENLKPRVSNLKSQISNLRPALYLAILLVQLVAIYFSGSRGPWLGLLAGLAVFAFALAAHSRHRRPAAGLLGLALATALFLAVLNL
ncbi:MAG: hypothetical protein HY784_04990, partial [Chloroflexi bacterium]|nr:hypothetical protein [Chloroflexota bacterium]